MGSLFSKPKAPKIEPPAPMPDEEQTERTRRRNVAKVAARSGRQSTIMSQGMGSGGSGGSQRLGG